MLLDPVCVDGLQDSNKNKACKRNLTSIFEAVTEQEDHDEPGELRRRLRGKQGEDETKAQAPKPQSKRPADGDSSGAASTSPESQNLNSSGPRNPGASRKETVTTATTQEHPTGTTRRPPSTRGAPVTRGTPGIVGGVQTGDGMDPGVGKEIGTRVAIGGAKNPSRSFGSKRAGTQRCSVPTHAT